MIDGVPRALTLVAAAGAAVAAGFYFAFSTVVMRALDRLSPAEGVHAMQSINRAAPAPFSVAFIGTGLVCVALAVVGLRQLDEPWAIYLLIGSALYLASILLTIVYHVPRNDALALVDATGPGAADAWRHYLTPWTMWNHVRMLASLGGAVSLILALRAR
jgi:uncharacterized membrane protein